MTDETQNLNVDGEDPRKAYEQLLRVTVLQSSDPATPVGTLDLFSYHKDHRVRRAIARNTSTPAAMLKRLSFDPNPAVRLDAVMNANAGNETLFGAENDHNAEVADAAREGIHRRVYLAHYCDCGFQHPDPEVIAENYGA